MRTLFTLLLIAATTSAQFNLQMNTLPRLQAPWGQPGSTLFEYTFPATPTDLLVVSVLDISTPTVCSGAWWDPAPTYSAGLCTGGPGTWLGTANPLGPVTIPVSAGASRAAYSTAIGSENPIAEVWAAGWTPVYDQTLTTTGLGNVFITNTTGQRARITSIVPQTGSAPVGYTEIPQVAWSGTAYVATPGVLWGQENAACSAWLDAGATIRIIPNAPPGGTHFYDITVDLYTN